jgi:hypothetical protein
MYRRILTCVKAQRIGACKPICTLCIPPQYCIVRILPYYMMLRRILTCVTTWKLSKHGVLSSSVTMIHPPSYTAATKQEQTWWTLIESWNDESWNDESWNDESWNDESWNDESWNDEHGMMSKKQEVGKGHIEPAIYITPYSEREEKHTHTHKQRSDRRHSSVCVAR